MGDCCQPPIHRHTFNADAAIMQMLVGTSSYFKSALELDSLRLSVLSPGDDDDTVNRKLDDEPAGMRKSFLLITIALRFRFFLTAKSFLSRIRPRFSSHTADAI